MKNTLKINVVEMVLAWNIIKSEQLFVSF